MIFRPGGAAAPAADRGGALRPGAGAEYCRGRPTKMIHASPAATTLMRAIAMGVHVLDVLAGEGDQHLPLPQVAAQHHHLAASA